MSTKHTPGPWLDYDRGDYISIRAKQGHDSIEIACMGCPEINEEERNNARLVCTAPEMLEAMIEFCDRVDKGEVRSKKTYAKFKLLINKATL